MGSCLTSESRSPRADSTPSPLKRKGSSRRLGSRSSSFDQLHRTPGCVYSNGASKNASLFSQQGKKGTNQDAMIVWEDFGSRTDTVFCGIFDGHGPYGHMVAKRVRDSLPLKLSSHWEVNAKSEEVLRDFSLNTTNNLFSEGTSLLAPCEQDRASFDVEDTEKQPEIFQTLKDSFLKAFKAMDRELRMYASTDCFCSGTTAVTLVKQGQDLVIGNVGDSRAVLGTRDGNNSLTAVQLTVDLKPDLPAEAERIRKCKGRVFALHDEPDVARVWLPNNNSPGLAMARAFGDFCLKDFGLISIPEVSYRRVTDKDEFIVLATDGIWDVLSNEEVVRIVGSTPTRSHCARALVQTAVKAWRSKYPTSKVDDCAVICLFLGSNEESCFSSTKSKDKNDSITSSDDRAGINGALNETVEEANDEGNVELDTERVGFEVGIDWSALEGVSRVNTLVTLPSFVPSKEDETARGVNARK